jgi:archaemetzincin
MAVARAHLRQVDAAAQVIPSMRGMIVLLVFACMACGTAGPRAGKDRLHLLLQPLGPVAHSHVDSVVAALEREHGARISIAPVMDLPRNAFINVKSPRYRADTLIAWLRTVKPDSVDRIVGLTAQDISITKYGEDGAVKEPVTKYRDFGIFGLSYIDGPSCVVSTFRSGDPRKPVFFERLCKVSVHEVGHTLGLDHCPDTSCVMRDAAERMANMDAEGRSLCAACARHIRER